MYCTRKITEDLYYIGQSDRRLSLFENIYPLENGVSYNSYLLLDDKTVVIDCVDKAISNIFFENIEHLLNGRKLDYLFIQHMEPDHSATVDELILRYPDVTIVCTQKAKEMIYNFFENTKAKNFLVVKEKDTLCTGKHNFTFLTAPMVHWPEVMVSYEITSKTLFSADAFGTFGSLSGNIFADEIDFEHEFLDEARRYYFNIVGKYGVPVQTLLKKASAVEVNTICPLHGPIFRENLEYIINKYNTWSLYQSEENSVLIVYSTIYNNTENAVEVLSTKLAELGVKNMGLFDSSKTDTSYLLSECFKYKTIVFASSSYNAGLFPKMETLLLDLKAHAFQNKNIALIENGSWMLTAQNCMKEIVQSLKNVNLIEPTISIKSSLKEEQLAQIEELAKALVNTL